MPCVEIFQNKKTKDLMLCSFVLCAELGGGYTPTGPLVGIPLDQFVKHGVDIVTKEFDLFYTRDYEVKSELYDEMTEPERNRFLSQHTKVMISQPKRNGPINVYSGPHDELFGRLDFPLDIAAFTGYILEALSKAG
jgi:hypothetical protein